MHIVPESIENTDSSFYALKFYIDHPLHHNTLMYQWNVTPLMATSPN